MYPLRRTERINRGRAWHALARRPPPPARAPAQPQVPLPFPSHSSPQKIPKEITLASEGGGAARLRAPRREAFQRCSLRRGCAPPPAFVSAAFLLPPRGLQNRPREEHAFGGQFRCAGGEGREDADPEDPEGPGQEEGQGRARRAARGGRGGAGTGRVEARGPLLPGLLPGQGGAQPHPRTSSPGSEEGGEVRVRAVTHTRNPKEGRLHKGRQGQ